MRNIKSGLLMATIICLLAVAFGSCRRASDNGKLDGYWKIREIHYSASNESVFPEKKFIAINLELLQLQNPGYTAALTGVISYSKGDSKLGVDFPNNPTEEQLSDFGFAGNPSTLQIKRLDSKNLVLESPIATITCKKF